MNHRFNDSLMLGQHRRRLTNINTTLRKGFIDRLHVNFPILIIWSFFIAARISYTLDCHYPTILNILSLHRPMCAPRKDIGRSGIRTRY